MYYKIIERFGPQDGEKWQAYLEWRGLSLSSFDSVDANLRPDLFEPVSDEDWDNCLNEDHKLGLITDLDYARRILNRYQNAVLVGVEIELEEGYASQGGLLGFDILDSYCTVSLLTNWGMDKEDSISSEMMPNALISDLGRALQIRDLLRSKFAEDPHAGKCEVWAVYGVDARLGPKTT